MKHIIAAFATVERILRSRTEYFREISQNQNLRVKIYHLLILITFGFGIFGFVAGLSGRTLAPALISIVKLPFLFLISGFICLPTLYYFSLLFGSQLKFTQFATLILTAQSVSAALALGITPISILFWISGSDSIFLTLLNIGALGLCAALGLLFLVQGLLYVQESQTQEHISTIMWIKIFFGGGLRSLVVIAWLLIYGLIGVQLSYSLRPFFGVSLEGTNFFNTISNAVIDLLRTR